MLTFVVISYAISNIRSDSLVVVVTWTSWSFVVLIQRMISAATISELQQTTLDFDFERADFIICNTARWATQTISPSHLVRVCVGLAQCTLVTLASLKWDLWMLCHENVKVQGLWKPLDTVPNEFERHYDESDGALSISKNEWFFQLLNTQASSREPLRSNLFETRIGFANKFNIIILVVKSPIFGMEVSPNALVW